MLTDLNPYLVGLHLLLSMVLISLAVWLVRLSRPLVLGRSRAVQALFRLGSRWPVVGDRGPRHRAHRQRTARRGRRRSPATDSTDAADQAALGGGVRDGGVTLACLIAAPQPGGRAAAGRRGLLQAGIGIAQYNLGLPIGLVVLHLLGAALAIAAGTNLMLSFRARPRPRDRRRRSGGRRARLRGLRHRPRAAAAASASAGLAAREARAVRVIAAVHASRAEKRQPVRSQACLRLLSQRRAGGPGRPARTPETAAEGAQRGADLVDAEPPGEGDVRAPAAVLEPGVRGGPQRSAPPVAAGRAARPTPRPGGPGRSCRGAARRAAGCR